MYQNVRLSDKMAKILAFSISLIILSASCVTQRDLEYMKKDKRVPAVVKEAPFSEYKLQPNDGLYIQINSLDDAASNIFAQNAAGGQTTLDPYSAYLNSYVIDEQGFVQLPVIGKIKVSGITTNQVTDLIKDSVQNILSLPVITVKLVNQYVTILGEVGTPGHYVYSQNKFNVFNALGLAGDISATGNREEITLIRNENGKTNRIKLDLTSPEILSSNYFYIQPNDVIYVKPLRKRIWGMETVPFAVIFSTITTGLLIYTIIQQ
ncbi:MAG TPA: polysaccharide biosynthesis/export family protein [Bacteroidales bacterium]|nr:polysaccharide biosynthesis/export family protein [Bacteroidales bacterium]